MFKLLEIKNRLKVRIHMIVSHLIQIKLNSRIKSLSCNNKKNFTTQQPVTSQLWFDTHQIQIFFISDDEISLMRKNINGLHSCQL